MMISDELIEHVAEEYLNTIVKDNMPFYIYLHNYLIRNEYHNYDNTLMYEIT